MKLPETLTYDDVTLAPAYSELTSRSDANPQIHGHDLPIIGSCMDTLGKDMMNYLISNNIPFIAHRAFKSAEEQYNYFLGDLIINNNDNKLKNLWFAVGSAQKYSQWIDYLIDHGVRQFCVDMAHGDSKACIDTIKYIKDELKYNTLNSSELLPGQTVHIIAGNVATKEGFKRLQDAGANGIRVGIASGQICFTGNTEVWTVSTMGKVYKKPIKFIKVGDIVLTKNGKHRKVLQTFVNPYKGEIYVINENVFATPNHKFYVIDHKTNQKSYKPIKDIDLNFESFLDYEDKKINSKNILVDIDEFGGNVYNIEVEEEHTYCVGDDKISVSNCSTNIETAMGLPILTSIIECNKVKKNGTWLIADGGVRSTGDIVKAVYFGADYCMIGKLLAATDLACGGCYNKDKQELNKEELFGCIFKHQIEDKLKEADKLDKKNKNTKYHDLVLNNIVYYRGYHGMASRAARANILGYASVEGVEGLIAAGETTEQFIRDTKLRLQSSLSYAGARNWEQFRKRAKPYKRSNAGILAADVHLDVITKYH